MRIGRPARARPSIYAHLCAHLTEDGLDEAGRELPDEDEAADGFAPRWAPGALDGVSARHFGPDGEEEVSPEEVHAALLDVADRPGRRSRARVRDAFRRARPRTQVDAVLERLGDSPPGDMGRLYVEMRTMAVESGRRNEVKFAIAILGRFGVTEDAEMFRTFARHEELTLYAAIALANVVDDPVDELLGLARGVHGWGRVELVELLVRSPRADACAWLLRGGFRNEIADGYTAQPVARHCDLAGALGGGVDSELLTGARDILSALAEDAYGGPGAADEMPWQAVRVAEGLGIAGRVLDLDGLGSCPGLCPESAVFTVVDVLLQALLRHPGMGWELIGPALRSPVVRHRHGAVRALSGWPPGLLTPARRRALEDAAGRDPDDEVRDAARRVLRGEPLDDG